VLRKANEEDALSRFSVFGMSLLKIELRSTRNIIHVVKNTNNIYTACRALSQTTQKVTGTVESVYLKVRNRIPW
jgi:hypothetical protein